jgi:hypothetical protein
VGVTAGLDVPSTLTWNGSSSTAPEIPAGIATTAMTYAAVSAATSVQPAPSTRPRYRVTDQAMNECPAKPKFPWVVRVHGGSVNLTALSHFRW